MGGSPPGGGSDMQIPPEQYPSPHWSSDLQEGSLLAAICRAWLEGIKRRKLQI